MKPKKVTVLKLKDILRLHYQAQLSTRQIARSLNVSRSVVSKYLIRARGAQLQWPLPEGIGETQLRDIDVSGVVAQRHDPTAIMGGIRSSAS